MMNEISILGQTTSWLEIFAMVAGLIGVWLTMKQNIWCFPIGIINVTLYAWLFMTPGIRLYADAILQCVYVLLLFYGWANWANKKKEHIHPVKIKTKSALNLLLTTATTTIILSLFLQEFTDASYPWLDSALTCASLSAQWMIAKKLIENWIVWIVIDVVYLPLYIMKNLPLTALLYVVFIVIAFKGYSEWKKNSAYREV